MRSQQSISTCRTPDEQGARATHVTAWRTEGVRECGGQRACESVTSCCRTEGACAAASQRGCAAAGQRAGAAAGQR
eukprot:94931-Prymnesium_polylepis.3